MTPTAKIITGIASVGVVGSGVSYAISKQFTTENISKKLVDEGYQILEDNSEEWQHILTSYLANTKDSLKFKNFAVAIGEVEKLKQECQKALNNPATDNDSYKKAEHWCTVPRTLKTLLEKGGYRGLDTSDNDENADKDKWNTKLDEHAKATGERKAKQFTGDSKIQVAEPVKQEKDNRSAIKIKCKELENKKHYELDIKDNLEKSKLWCAIQKTTDS